MTPILEYIHYNTEYKISLKCRLRANKFDFAVSIIAILTFLITCILYNKGVLHHKDAMKLIRISSGVAVFFIIPNCLVERMFKGKTNRFAQ